MIITIAAMKGGSGKSTLAMNLAPKIAVNDALWVCDVDPQQSFRKWHVDRQEQGKNDFGSVQLSGSIHKDVVRLHETCKAVLIDCQGRIATETKSALMVTDVLIVPCQATQLDIDALAEMFEEIEMIRVLNPRIKVCVLHTLASTNPALRKTERATFEQVVSEFKGDNVTLLDASMSYRKAYRDAASLGLAAWEMGASASPKCNDEIEAILSEVLALAGGKNAHS